METRHPRDGAGRGAAARSRPWCAGRSRSRRCASSDSNRQSSCRSRTPGASARGSRAADRSRRQARRGAGIRSLQSRSDRRAGGARRARHAWCRSIDGRCRPIAGRCARRLNAIAAGEADVALFTSATQVSQRLQVAEAEGCGAGRCATASRAMVVGSIGPVCSAAAARARHAGRFRARASEARPSDQGSRAQRASILDAQTRPRRIAYRRRVAAAPAATGSRRRLAVAASGPSNDEGVPDASPRPTRRSG